LFLNRNEMNESKMLVDWYNYSSLLCYLCIMIESSKLQSNRLPFKEVIWRYQDHICLR
jgi:hypothetical protein